MNAARILVVIPLLAWCVGCGPETKIVHLYPQGERPAVGVAVVKAADQFGTVFIEKVDGVDLNTGQLRTWSPGINPPRATEVHVSAGSHVIEVSWKSPFGSSISNATLKFTADADHTYEVWADNIPPDSVLGKVALAVVGGRERWTAWVVDKDSGKVVGGRRPPSSNQ